MSRHSYNHSYYQAQSQAQPPDPRSHSHPHTSSHSHLHAHSHSQSPTEGYGRYSQQQAPTTGHYSTAYSQPSSTSSSHSYSRHEKPSGDHRLNYANSNPNPNPYTRERTDYRRPPQSTQYPSQNSPTQSSPTHSHGHGYSQPQSQSQSHSHSSRSTHQSGKKRSRSRSSELYPRSSHNELPHRRKTHRSRSRSNSPNRARNQMSSGNVAKPAPNTINQPPSKQPSSTHDHSSKSPTSRQPIIATNKLNNPNNGSRAASLMVHEESIKKSLKPQLQLNTQYSNSSTPAIRKLQNIMQLSVDDHSDDDDAIGKRRIGLTDFECSLSDSSEDEHTSEKKEANNADDQMSTSETNQMANDADEEDPLDQFLQGLSNNMSDAGFESQNGAIEKHQNRGNDKEVYFGDDEGTLDEDELYSLVKVDDENNWKTKLKKKEIKPVDHSKIDYPEFQRNFWIESRDIAAKSEEEIADWREKELEGVKIRGKNCPRPFSDWVQCGLPAPLYDVIVREQFAKPFPIQMQAIPVIMSGRDCIACAKTGSGKTLAYVLPMLRHVMAQPRCSPGEGPVAIVLAPTRELAVQIYRQCRLFSKSVEINAACVYGGAGVAEQISVIKKGIEVIVGTPGRFIDLLCTNGGRVLPLNRTTMIILDEADRMFDMGFEPQISKIMENIRPDRQTVMFSATFPQSVEKVAHKTLKNAIEIIIGTRSTVSNTITQVVEVRSADMKFVRLLEILGNWHTRGSIIIFVDKQDAVDTLFRKLMDAGYDCLSLHGGMDQYDRDSTLTDFTNGVRTILVATSVVARGLDVKDCVLVVNYEIPNHYEDYVHRVGRTGRAGKNGTAITMVEPDQYQIAPDLVKALKASSQEVPEELERMAKAFEAKIKSGDTKKTSGFHGKGYKFDQSENAERKEVERILRLAHNPDTKKEELDELKDELWALEKHGENKKDISSEDVKKVQQKSSTNITQPSSQSPPPPAQLTLSLPLPPPVDPVARQIAAAKAAAAAVAAAVKQGTTSTAEVQAHIAAAKQQVEMKTIEEAAERARTLANALALQHSQTTQQQQQQLVPANQVSKTISTTFDTTTGTSMRTAEVEINDYPQHARWKVTHKGALDAICVETDTAVTTKGGFIPPTRKPNEGERKLYLYIEGKSDVQVIRCKNEIVRIIEEAAREVANKLANDPAAARMGRYTVV